MRHSGNWSTVIDQTYGGEGVTMKIYVYDEVGRFVTVSSLSLGTRELETHLTGVRLRREELDQLPLF
uniref:Uncharacterized protein n=1 Tax=uncultured prokaryote TaxID=198431 RepID=A0A0H5Q798_9ZZZZ|nr:hypothetical protein [uncultured prokaryote]